MSFSERLGFKKPKLELQFDEVDQPLKNRLWNILLFNYFFDVAISGHEQNFYYSDYFEKITSILWQDYFKFAIDDRPEFSDHARAYIKKYFLSSNFPETYDFIEFMASLAEEEKPSVFCVACNKILEREKSAFRFIGQQLAQIANKTEIAEIEKAQSQQDSKSVSTHIDTAVACYSNREKPDYRNSIKESILAVEAAAIKITEKPKATLGAALKELRKSNALPTVLNEGFTKLYGWTSGPNGIRHALEDETNVGEAEARYMLVSCSAFSNYLLSKKT